MVEGGRREAWSPSGGVDYPVPGVLPQLVGFRLIPTPPGVALSQEGLATRRQCRQPQRYLGLAGTEDGDLDDAMSLCRPRSFIDVYIRSFLRGEARGDAT